jgi:FKBP-type peptidyl-prolyl cis-trans isomerase
MKAGRDFLEQNAKNEGVKATASGLQYKALNEGSGAKPDASAEVEVHYEGRLIDGTVFDSSYQRGEPISFLLSQVIPGWREGVQLMPVGSKYELYIPHELAYGPNGIPGVIPPFSTLIFTIELLKIF